MSGLTVRQRQLLEQLKLRESNFKAATHIQPREIQSKTSPLSFGQERLLVVERSMPGSSMFVGKAGMRLVGDLDVTIMRAALSDLLERHGALRTSIVDDPETGQPVQHVHDPQEVRIDLPIVESTSTDAEYVAAQALAGDLELSIPPLLRMVLVRISDQPRTWLLSLAAHHIVIDGWSVGLLLSEFSQLYSARERAAPVLLPDLPVSYADFAVWQHEQFDTGLLDEQTAYWRDHLIGAPLIDIPTDRPRREARDYHGDSVPLLFPPEVVSGLRQLADTHQATLFMVLVAAWATTIRLWSGQNDVVLGTPVAGRRWSEVENVVGFFVNTLPIRVRSGPTDSFERTLSLTRDACVEAARHQDVPFDRIVAESDLERDMSGHTQLSRYWIALDNTPKNSADLPGLTTEHVPAILDTVRCDLSVQLTPGQDGGLWGQVEFATALFDEETAAAIARTFASVLESAASARTARHAFLPTEVQHRVALSAPAPECPHPTVVQWFEAVAASRPDAVATIAETEASPQTYAEVAQRTRALASALIKLGVGLGDAVVVHISPSTDRIVALLSVLSCGAIYVPLHEDDPPQRREAILADTTPSVIVVRGSDHPDFNGATVVDIEDVLEADTAMLPRVSPDSPAYVMFTSGTSGAPKGVIVDHAALVNRLAGMQAAYQLTPDDRVLHKTPVGFDVSLWEMLWPVMNGASVVIVRPGGHRDIAYLHEAIDRHGVTVCHFVPSMLDEFVREEGTEHPSLRLLFSGGERLTANLAARVRSRWPELAFYNQYGPTETVIDVTAVPVVNTDDSDIPIGWPVPGVELFVMDGSGTPQDPRQPGELYVGGKQVALGYLNRPDQTTRSFVPHPYQDGLQLYRTGDRVRLRPGRGLEFLGRIDDQIKIHGHRIELAEVEHHVRAVPGVRDALVRAQRDNLQNDNAHDVRLVAHILSDDEPDPLISAIKEALRGALPQAAIPLWFSVLPQWPRTEHGKVNLRALPRPKPVTSPTHEEPRGRVETQLAELCAELLKVSSVGRSESFFELGGHSLFALRAISRIRAVFGVRVTIAEFFESPDVASLAGVIVARKVDSVDAPIQAIPRLSRRSD